MISDVLRGIIGLLKLLVFILFVAHWIACFWHLIGLYQEKFTPTTWLWIYNLQNEEWFTRYIASLYWAVTTMIIVGYGDIIP